MLKILLKGCNVEHFFFLTVHVSIVDFLFLFFNGTLSCNGFIPISLQHHKQCLVWWPSKACALKKKKMRLDCMAIRKKKIYVKKKEKKKQYVSFGAFKILRWLSKDVTNYVFETWNFSLTHEVRLHTCSKNNSAIPFFLDPIAMSSATS